MTPRILVTDGNQRSALAVVRSLGKAGHRVHVTAPSLPALASVSRYCVEAAEVPAPAADSEGFAERIGTLGRRWDIDVLIPATDAAMAAALTHRDRLEPMLIPAPAAEDFLAISDRARLLEEASALGITIPEQTVLPCPDEIQGVTERARVFPLAIKPARAYTSPNGGPPAPRVRYCDRPENLRRVLSEFPAAAYPLLLQQTVLGDGMGVFLLLWEGELVAAFAHRRIREKPPSGGVSVLRESVALDPRLTELSRRLLERFSWQGVAMVEYKGTPEAPVLMEVNGRFWGSLQLALDAGVDFPRLLVDAALGRPLAPPPPYRVGVRTRWMWGEVDHFASIVLGRSLPAGAREGRLRPALAAMRGWLKPAHNEVFRASDPRPFVRETVDWIRSVRHR